LDQYKIPGDMYEVLKINEGLGWDPGKNPKRVLDSSELTEPDKGKKKV